MVVQVVEVMQAMAQMTPNLPACRRIRPPLAADGECGGAGGGDGAGDGQCGYAKSWKH